ncbi:MAG TPA: hypothetical protein ENI56_03075 [Candidatus Kaiserbacteria bacterium]|nr:hypothetical protein [Candidatus Kaiserbacteria bacterium]
MGFFKNLGKMTGSPGINTSPMPLLVIGLTFFFLSIFLFPGLLRPSLYFFIFLAPVVLPFIFIYAAFRVWVDFRQSAYIVNQEHVLLEIKPPRSHMKTPLAMEAIFSGLHLKPGESTWYDRIIRGKTRPWWSFEIAVIDGTVHFFIWTRATFRNIVEAQVYAQIPGAQILTAPDYARAVSGLPSEWGIWGVDFEFTKPDPYPIRTYIDYSLDKKPTKEIEQVDPLAHMIEYFGTFGKGEQVWFQILARVHKGDKYHKKNVEGKPYTWQDEGKEIIQNIRTGTVGKVKYRDVFTGEMRETDGFPNPTKGESEKMAAIERNVAKQAFDVGIRAVYITEPDKFVPSKIPGIIGVLRQFSSESYNSFKPVRWIAPFNDYPWELFVKKRKDRVRKRLIDAYRRRSYFYAPYITPHNIMSIEELATIYHIPSASVATPALSRIQSATQTPPANLPT